jgi:predicted transcriptional regulator
VSGPSSHALEGKLARTADRRGVSAAVLIREVIERAVDYDDRFIREVAKGLAQVDAGRVLTHEAVGARLEQKLAEHQSRRCWNSGGLKRQPQFSTDGRLPLHVVRILAWSATVAVIAPGNGGQCPTAATAAMAIAATWFL